MLKYSVLFLKFVAITVPLTWLWMEWGKEAYGTAFQGLARPIYDLLGYRTLRPSQVHERFLNFLPFLVLMLLTPRLSVVRRVTGIVVGCIVLMMFHVVFSLATAWGPRTAGGGMTSEAFEISFAAYLFSDSLPLLLWAIIAHRVVADFATRAIQRIAPEDATPDS
jgi:hypothetical protein